MRKCAGDLCAAKRPGKDKPVFRSKAIGALLGGAPERGNFSRSQAYSEVPQSPVEYFAKASLPRAVELRAGIPPRSRTDGFICGSSRHANPRAGPHFGSGIGFAESRDGAVLRIGRDRTRE